MSLTVNLWSRKNGDLKRFLESYFDREMDINENTMDWSYCYRKPLEAVDIISAAMDNCDKYQIYICIMFNGDQLHIVTPENHNEVIRDIFQLFYHETAINYN